MSGFHRSHTGVSHHSLLSEIPEVDTESEYCRHSGWYVSEIPSVISFEGQTSWKANETLPWIKTRSADLFFAAAIIVNAIVLGVEAETALQNGGVPHVSLFWIQLAFYVLFLLELVLRIRADGHIFFRLTNWAGLFDFFVVFSSTIEFIILLASGGGNSNGMFFLSAMRMARLMRIVRIARIIHLCPEVWLLISSLACSLKAVFWTFVLLMVIMYIGSLICALELGMHSCTQCSPERERLIGYFGSVDRSFYTHFMLLTLEGFPAVARDAGKVSWLWYIYISCFILFTSMVLLNIVIAIILENVMCQSKQIEDDAFLSAPDVEEFEELFLNACLALGFRPESTLDQAEFENLLAYPIIREILDSFDICVCVPEDELFRILDADNRGTVTTNELCGQFLRLRGTKERIQSLMAQGDFVRGHKELSEQLDGVRDNILAYSSKLHKSFNEHFVGEMAALSGTLQQLELNDEPPDDVTPATTMAVTLDPNYLVNVLVALEAQSAEAGGLLAKLRKELEASRARVRNLKGRLGKRSVMVQTDNLVLSISDQWNMDRDRIVQPMSILSAQYSRLHSTGQAKKPVKLPEIDQGISDGISEAVEMLLDQQSRDRKGYPLPATVSYQPDSAREGQTQAETGNDAILLDDRVQALPGKSLEGYFEENDRGTVTKLHGRHYEKDMVQMTWDGTKRTTEIAKSQFFGWVRIIDKVKEESELPEIPAEHTSLEGLQEAPRAYLLRKHMNRTPIKCDRLSQMCSDSVLCPAASRESAPGNNKRDDFELVRPPPKKGVEVTILGASGLLDARSRGKLNSYCICKLRTKIRPNTNFQTSLAWNTSNPVWNETHHFEQYELGEPFDFHILTKNSKGNTLLYVASLQSEHFLPQGFHGDLQLEPTELREHANRETPILSVKVSVQGTARTQAGVLPPMELGRLGITLLERDPGDWDNVWETPRSEKKSIPVDHPILKRFRAHSCHSGKNHALHATRTPSSSDQEESARSRVRRPAKRRTRLSQSLPKIFGSTPSSTLASSQTSPLTLPGKDLI